MKVDMQIRLLSPKDGDCIVVTSPYPLNQELRARITEQVGRVVDSLGIRAKVLVLPDGLEAELQVASDAA